MVEAEVNGDQGCSLAEAGTQILPSRAQSPHGEPSQSVFSKPRTGSAQAEGISLPPELKQSLSWAEIIMSLLKTSLHINPLNCTQFFVAKQTELLTNSR